MVSHAAAPEPEPEPELMQKRGRGGRTTLDPIRGRGIVRVERKVRVAGEGDPIDGERVERLGRLERAGRASRRPLRGSRRRRG
jgi:hypothetical protein